MIFRFTFKHMSTSNALRVYAEEKISAQIAKFVSKPIDAHLTFSIEHLDHRVHLSLVAGDGFSLQVEGNHEDMYGAIDLMIDKLEVQLKRHKEKLKGHKYPSIKAVPALATEDASAAEASDLGAVRMDEDAVDAAELLAYENARRAHFDTTGPQAMHLHIVRSATVS